jgi:spermidine synthase
VITAEKLDQAQRNPVRAFFALEDHPKERILWPLFFVSFASLYLEILLIRWIGTEVRVFAYFQNLALIACFLGFGIGCYRSKAKKVFLFNAVALGILVILVGLPFTQWQSVLESLSSVLSFSPDAQIWSALIPIGGYPLAAGFIASVLLISGLLGLVIATMIPLGQWVGTYLDAAKNPVTAYSANLLGSLGGIWFFAGMSFLGLAPVFWFGFVFLLFLLFVLARRPVQRSQVIGSLLLGGSLVLLAYAAFGRGQVHWSPYQKLEVHPVKDQQFNISVNNTGYMTIANLSPEHLAADPGLANNYRNSSYDAPFRLVGSRDRVLIVGAGAGNDADAALRNGAGSVDAIEIDPVIYSLGKRLHPDHPYDSSRVHVIINDARAFLRQSRDRYDAIVFGLLDSHTGFSGYSNMRIDNYVYTEESLREAKRLLKPSGVLIVKFEVRGQWTWMGQRFYSMFNHLFGRPPVTFYAPATGAMLSATEFIASNDSSAWDRAAQPQFAEMIKKHPPSFSLDLRQAPPVTTDDWPYVYHRGHTIPRTYLTISLILLGMAFFAARRAFEPAKVSTWNFFFLGAGFLLLETQMISRLALYFGATWWVNCFALSGILFVLVISNFCVERGAARAIAPWYVGLLASVLAIYFVRWESLPFGTITVGALLAAGYCTAVFFAGVIFTETLRRCKDKSRCFGSNIVGAVAGGLAQNASFVIGMKALLLLTAVFYLLAAVLAALSKYRASTAAASRPAASRNGIHEFLEQNG